MHKTKPKLAAQELFDYAVKSLSRRAQSSAELRQKLRERAAEAEFIDEVLGRLQEYGYLDDKRFAENYAASRLENERFGRVRTLNDLRARRVTGQIADAPVENTYKETDDTALVEAYIRKKFRSAPRETLFQSDKDLARGYNRLLRAGFRPAVIVPVLKRFAKNPDLLDAIEETDTPED